MSRVSLVVALAIAITSLNGWADEPQGTLKKIIDSKVIRLGYQKELTPFSFASPDSKPKGYSIELCYRIVAGIRNEFAMALLDIEWIQVTLTDRFQLPDILDVPDLDAVFLGPVDLSQSLGLGLQPEHPKVVETVGEVMRAAADKGKATAVFAPTAAAARRWLDRGVGFVAVSIDTAVIAAAFRDLLAQVRTTTAGS